MTIWLHGIYVYINMTKYDIYLYMNELQRRVLVQKTFEQSLFEARGKLISGNWCCQGSPKTFTVNPAAWREPGEVSRRYWVCRLASGLPLSNPIYLRLAYDPMISARVGGALHYTHWHDTEANWNMSHMFFVLLGNIGLQAWTSRAIYTCQS